MFFYCKSTRPMRFSIRINGFIQTEDEVQQGVDRAPATQGLVMGLSMVLPPRRDQGKTSVMSAPLILSPSPLVILPASLETPRAVGVIGICIPSPCSHSPVRRRLQFWSLSLLQQQSGNMRRLQLYCPSRGWRECILLRPQDYSLQLAACLTGQEKTKQRTDQRANILPFFKSLKKK